MADENDNECEICGRSFDSEEELHRHAEEEHEDERSSSADRS